MGENAFDQAKFSKGYRRYRCSKGIVHPKKIRMNREAVLKEISNHYQKIDQVSFSVIAVKDDGTEYEINHITKELFKIRRK